MGNENEEILIQENSQHKTEFKFSKKEQLTCFKGLSKELVKLLYMIEEEQKTGKSIDLWFYGLMYELTSSNILCENKLTKVIVKIFGLYENQHYKTLNHDQIKRQIFEAKGVLDYLIDDLKKDIKGQQFINQKINNKPLKNKH